ncbi:MAG: anhydro-N-acetylmuramic acid kinase, partial [Aquisalimonadaceae bacterium]
RHAMGCQRVLLSGGGARNAYLRARIAANLAGIPVEPTDLHGVSADWVEGVGFAWLAGETLAGRSGNIPAVTGARHPVVLGAIYQGKPIA